MVDHTKPAPQRHWVRWLTLSGSASLIMLLAPSCLYDKDKPCGDDLVVDKDASGNPRCVCPMGSVYSPTGCVECGDNQIVQGAQCVCDEGYMMGADGNCQEVVDTSTSGSTTNGAGGTGNSSTSGSNGNTTGASGAAGAGGEGGDSSDGGESTTTDGGTTGGTTTSSSTSSTTGSTPSCTINDECAAGEICDVGVCRLPTGFGDACAVPTDCPQEANFCDFIQYKCTVSNCTLAPDNCPATYECCDLSGFGLPALCIPDGACTT